MTSETGRQEAFVWTWPPGQTRPVVAGRLAAAGDRLVFNYGRSYLARKNAISLYEPALPLQPGALPLRAGLSMPNCLRDAAPDAWGRRVIINRKIGAAGRKIDTAEFDELTYLLESASDRSGALDFQQSATTYVAREAAAASLDDLLTPERGRALPRGRTPQSRPYERAVSWQLDWRRASQGDDCVQWKKIHRKILIAKFSSQNDVYSVVKAEYIAMQLAAEAGIDVAPTTLRNVGGKDVLLVERFDREKAQDGWRRRAMVSALTLLELDEMMARYASYEDLATIIRHRFTAPTKTLRELYARLVFNVLCGNTDDHARNHSAFWDGRNLTLTPSYDICPQARAGGEATQAMLIVGDERLSGIDVCLRAAPQFLLSSGDAFALVERQIEVVRDQWVRICAQATLSDIDRNLLWRRQFLNPFVFEGAPPALAGLLA
jgi:serine/threonine-protein kinase HipA